jgi:adenine-specific DNA-methyltransferase
VRRAATRKDQLGQFFTTHPLVQQVMGALVTHGPDANMLEPSAGAGHLAAVLEQQGARPTCVELDTTVTPVCASPLIFSDFFTWADQTDTRFDVIFGNPPYVTWREVPAATRATIGAVADPYSGKANLFHLFIDRCIDLLAADGELIFIVPKEWLFATSAAPLRRKIAAHGALTHLVDCGEERLFADAAVPAIVIFRFVRAATQGPVRWASGLDAAAADVWSQRTLWSSQDRWRFVDAAVARMLDGWGVLGDVASVKVGMVSGNDSIFAIPDGVDVPDEFVSEQVTSKRTADRYLWLEEIPDATAFDERVPPSVKEMLEPHRETLISRRISAFDENSWWRWGAVRNGPAMRSQLRRFFVPTKTRRLDRFFAAPAGGERSAWFNGSVHGVFVADDCPLSVEEMIAVGNDPRMWPVFEACGITSGSKVSFQPSTLMAVPWPTSRAAFDAFMASHPTEQAA